MVVLFLLLMGEVAGDNGVWYKLQHNNIVVVLLGIFGGGSRKLFLVSFQFLRQTDRLLHPLCTPRPPREKKTLKMQHHPPPSGRIRFDTHNTLLHVDDGVPILPACEISSRHDAVKHFFYAIHTHTDFAHLRQ